MKKKYKVLLFGLFPILLFLTVKVMGKSLDSEKTEFQPSDSEEKFEANSFKKPSTNSPFVLTKYMRR